MFLSQGNIAVLSKLDDIVIKLEGLFDCELLAFLCKELSLLKVFLLCRDKVDISQKQSVVGLKIDYTEVFRVISL